MKASGVLRKAGDVLRERGWTRGVAGNHPYSTSLCLMGAINVARERYMGCYDQNGLESLRLMTGEFGVWQFNDAPGRTAAEVMHALDAAYVLALQEEGVEPEDVL